MAISKEKQQIIHETRRTQILDAAMELFDTYGFSNTKMSDIAEKAGISKGLIYHYFKAKEDIIYSLVGKLEACIKECSEQESGRVGIELFTLRLLSYPYYEGYVPPLRVFYTAITRGEIKVENLDYPIKDDFGKRYFGELFRRGQEVGEFKEGDPEFFGEFYWNYLIGSMANMNVKKEGCVYHPDVKAALKLFEKDK